MICSRYRLLIIKISISSNQERYRCRKILILVSDEALRSKLIQKGYIRQNVGVIVVKPGKEAVDNRIKGILGNLMNQENRGCIFVISHDHGYYKLINRYRIKYGIHAEMLDLKTSILAAL